MKHHMRFIGNEAATLHGVEVKWGWFWFYSYLGWASSLIFVVVVVVAYFDRLSFVLPPVTVFVCFPVNLIMVVKKVALNACYHIKLV